MSTPPIDRLADPSDPLAAVPERAMLVGRAFGPAQRRALLVAATLAVVVGALLGFALTRPLGWLVGAVLAAGAAAALGIVVAWLTTPRPLRLAYASFSWLGRRELDRLRRRTGSPMPGRVEDLPRWLDEHPPGDATRAGRVEALVFLGRFDQARAELDAARPASAFERFEVAALTQYVGWVEDGAPGLHDLESAVARLAVGSEDRLEGDVALALATARERLATGRADWAGPLVAAHPRLAGPARRVVLRDTGLRLAFLAFAFALVVALVAGSFARG